MKKKQDDIDQRIRAWNTDWILQFTDWISIAPALYWLKRKTAKSLTLDISDEKDLKDGAMFLSNHRDIVMDVAWLSYLLRIKKNIRPYFGLGNNLFCRWWLESFFKFNLGFAVLRNGSPRELLSNSLHLSAYIRLLRDKKKCVWLAQREGRAKDGNDVTQIAVLKMLVMSDGDNADETVIDKIQHFNICPVSISYEYDPCDYLKAAEMQLKRDNPRWRKTKEDDMRSMKTGIKGQKGNVVFRITPSINHWIDAHRDELTPMSKNEQLGAIAQQIDLQIHSAYEIYDRGESFERYIESRIQLIDIPNKDEDFLREKLYEMYNNITKNYEKSHLSREF